MSNVFEKLFSCITGKKLSENESTETKKCLNCLRRVSAHYNKCPHCRTYNFQYDN